jgi:hypothetical protein
MSTHVGPTLEEGMLAGIEVRMVPAGLLAHPSTPVAREREAHLTYPACINLWRGGSRESRIPHLIGTARH